MFGCGYIGTRIAKVERQAGHSVLCVVQSTVSATALRAAGFAVQQCDLDRHTAIETTAVNIKTNIDVLYYLVPPTNKGIVDLRSQQALKWLAGSTIKHIVLISTTGVYGDCGGAWIDETRALNPTAERSIRRVDSENTWRQWALERAIRLSVLRVAGIYAADRLPEKRIRQQIPVLSESVSPFSNRIHADDLVNACIAAAQGEPSGIYNIADDQPTTMSDYFFRVADALGLPRPAQISLSDARATFSPAMLSYLNESRRIDNRKMKAELGVQLRYPTLADGLRAIPATTNPVH